MPPTLVLTVDVNSNLIYSVCFLSKIRRVFRLRVTVSIDEQRMETTVELCLLHHAYSSPCVVVRHDV